MEILSRKWWKKSKLTFILEQVVIVKHMKNIIEVLQKWLTPTIKYISQLFVTVPPLLSYTRDSAWVLMVLAAVGNLMIPMWVWIFLWGLWYEKIETAENSKKNKRACKSARDCWKTEDSERLREWGKRENPEIVKVSGWPNLRSNAISVSQSPSSPPSRGRWTRWSP